jgi:hypothetical protein
MVMPPRTLRLASEGGARALESSGGSHGFLAALARRESALGEMSSEARAGLLIALDELAEAEALEAEWREAEELAAISDGELTQVPGFQEFRRRVLENGD